MSIRLFVLEIPASRSARPPAGRPPAGRLLLGRWLVPLLLALLANSAWSQAPVVPVGGEFQVNTSTECIQVHPSVAMSPDGAFVVVWQSDVSTGTDTELERFSVQGQRYASDGSALGVEFQVNTYTTGTQYSASVSVAPAGDFVVVWKSFGSSGTDTYLSSIQGQRYASDGSTLGGEFQINTYTHEVQTGASVSVGPAGDFVVVWDSFGSNGTDVSGRSVQGQRYASDGSALGGEFQVNTYWTSWQDSPSVSVGPDGSFVVVWHSDGSSDTDRSSLSVQGQRYASAGFKLGGEFQVNTYTTHFQDSPSVSVGPDGDFVVVWRSYGSSGTDTGSTSSIQGQRYASDGSVLGGEFQINTYTTGTQRAPSVSVDPDGDFVVVWWSDGSSGTDTSAFSVQGQLYASDGSALGGEFQINTYTTLRQWFPSVSMGPDGDFVVVWGSQGSSGTDDEEYSVQGQRYRVKLGAIFVDGFENGDTSSWSSNATP